MIKPLISIILPNYNHAKFLRERLDSIFNQTYQNFEVIILDDASTDNSIDVLELYRNHPKVSHFIVNEKNTGSPFKQWQKGLNLAKGDFIWIAESDDFCKFNFLEEQLKCLGMADVAVAKTRVCIDNEIKNEVIHPYFDEAKQENTILYCPILNVSSVLFKSKLVHNFEDEFYLNFKIIGDRVFYFEYLRNASLVFNSNTINYFRKSSASISKLDDQNFNYYLRYFNEHCKFISYAKKKDTTITRDISKHYIRKFYYRVSNRIIKENKYTIAYLHLFLLYRCRLMMK